MDSYSNYPRPMDLSTNPYVAPSNTPSMPGPPSLPPDYNFSNQGIGTMPAAVPFKQVQITAPPSPPVQPSAPTTGAGLPNSGDLASILQNYGVNIAGNNQPSIPTLPEAIAYARQQKGSDLTSTELTNFGQNYRSILSDHYLKMGMKQAEYKDRMQDFDKNLPSFLARYKTADDPNNDTNRPGMGSTFLRELGVVGSTGLQGLGWLTGAGLSSVNDLVRGEGYLYDKLGMHDAANKVRQAGMSVRDLADTVYSSSTDTRTSELVKKANAVAAEDAAAHPYVSMGSQAAGTAAEVWAILAATKNPAEAEALLASEIASGTGSAGRLVKIYNMLKNTSAAQRVAAGTIGAQNTIPSAVARANTPEGASVPQALTDLGINTAMGIYAPGMEGSLGKRLLKGGVGGYIAQQGQQGLDKYAFQDPNAQGPQFDDKAGVSAIYSALLAGLFGRNRGNKPLAGSKDTTGTVDNTNTGGGGTGNKPLATEQTKTTEQPANVEQPKAAATQTPAEGTVPQGINTVTGVSEHLNQPIVGTTADKDYEALKTTVLGGTVEDLKDYKKAFGAKTEPSRALAVAENIARQKSGDAWGNLTIAQRGDLAATIAETIQDNGGKVKDFGQAVQQYRDDVNGYEATQAKANPSNQEVPIQNGPIDVVGDGKVVPGTAGVIPAEAAPAASESAPAQGAAPVAEAAPPPAAAPAAKALKGGKPLAASKAAPVKVEPITFRGSDELRAAALPKSDKDTLGTILSSQPKEKVDAITKVATKLGYKPEDVAKLSADQLNAIVKNSIPAEQGLALLKQEAAGKAKELSNIVKSASTEPTTKEGQGAKLTAAADKKKGNIKIGEAKPLTQEAKPAAPAAKGGKKLVKGEAKAETKTEPTKTESPPPKQEAPAQVATGAEESLKTGNEKQETSSAAKSDDFKTKHERVADVLRDNDLTDEQSKDLHLALDRSNNGDHSYIDAWIKDNREDLTKAQVTKIRQIARSDQTTAPRELLRAKLRAMDKETDQLEKETGESNLKGSLFDIADEQKARLDSEDRTGEAPPDEPKPVRVTARVTGIVDGVRSGKLSNEDAVTQMSRLANDLEDRNRRNGFNKYNRGTARGADHILSRLYKFRDQHPDSAPAIDFAVWLLNKNPDLANTLGISIRDKVFGGGQTAAGKYNPVTEIAAISKSDHGDNTIVHEILHHVERLLPRVIQEKIRTEFFARLANKIKQADRTGNKEGVKYLQTALEQMAHPTQEGQKAMADALLDGKVDRSYYKYMNPSEYWATEGPRILRGKLAAEQGSWVAKAKEFMKEFIEHAKDFLGWENTSGVYKGLKYALGESDGERASNEMLSQNLTEHLESGEPEKEVKEGVDIQDAVTGVSEAAQKNPALMTDKDAEVIIKQNKINQIKESSVGKAQKLVEDLIHKTEGIDKTTQAAYRAGVEITEKNNLPDGVYLYNGDTQFHTNNFLEGEAKTFLNWVHSIAYNTHEDAASFLEDLGKYAQSKGSLERGVNDWLRNVDLNGGYEIQRNKIIKDAIYGRLTPEQTIQGLTDLANKYAVHSLAEYIELNGAGNIAEQARKFIAEQDSIPGRKELWEEANKQMQPIRDAQRRELIAANKLSQYDINLADSYGWKWYLTLTGKPHGTGPENIIDIMNIRRQDNLRQFAQELKVAEGRKSWAEKPVARTILSVTRASERRAWNDFVERIYNLVRDSNAKKAELKDELDKLKKTPNPDKEKIASIARQIADLYHSTGRIDVYSGDLARGFKNLKTKEEVDNIPIDSRSVVYHDEGGETHYVIRLNDESQLRRGLLQMNNEYDPHQAVKWLGKVTNINARLVSTLSPIWATTTQAIRTMLGTPIVVAVQKFDNPLQATGFFANTALNSVKLLGNFGQLKNILTANRAEYAKYAEANPDSAAGWVYRYQKMGGELNHSQMFNLSNADKMFNNSLRDIHSDWRAPFELPKLGWDNALKYTGRYISSIDMMFRAASFKTLVESGLSEREAAARVRKTLDYSESGRLGRAINSVYAFSRVGLTSLDVARTSFKNRDGSYNFRKMAMWQGYLASAGGLLLTLLYQANQNNKDDDGVPVLDKLSTDTLSSSIPIPLPDGSVAKMQVGLGLPQIMIAPGMLAAAYTNGKISLSQAVDAYYDTIKRNTPTHAGKGDMSSPGGAVTGLIQAFTPTVARPFADLAVNKNIFGAPIHRPQQNENLPSSMQGFISTPDEFKQMAEWIRQNTENYTPDGRGVDFHPEDYKYLIQSYGGQWATVIMSLALDKHNKESQGVEPTPLAGLANGLLANDRQFYLSRELYDTLDNLRGSVLRRNALVAQKTQENMANGMDEKQARIQAREDVTSIVNSDKDFQAKISAFDDITKAEKERFGRIHELQNNKLASPESKLLERKKADSALRQVLDKYMDYR